MTDKQETGVFIIWEKGRYLSVPILRDISTEFEIKKYLKCIGPNKSLLSDWPILRKEPASGLP